MHIFVGLGNPGKKYENTRHNVGWRVLSYFMEQHAFPKMVSSSKYSGEISEGVFESVEVSVLFPDTFMNKSGSAVKKIVGTQESEYVLTVVYDDVDLPIGDVKVSYGRGSGGHNGIESIISALGTKDFVRIRVGVAKKGLFGDVKRPKGEKLNKHVLGTFGILEKNKLKEADEKVNAILEMIVREGYETAMNKHN